MMVDYWLVRKGNIHVSSLYRPDPDSPYYYTKGVNFRAYAAWVVGIVLVISGISGAINPGSISETAVNIYNCGFILSLTGAAVTYYLLCRIWPVIPYPRGVHEGESRQWETTRSMEGFFPDDKPLPEYIQNRIMVGEEPMTTQSEENIQTEKEKKELS